MAFEKERRQQKTIKSQVLVEIKEGGATGLTGTELRRKISRLEGYIRRVEGRLYVYRRKLKGLRDIKASEKAKVQEGLRLLNLKKSEFLEL